MIGTLGERISIECSTSSADGYGGQTKTWSELASVWANAKPRGGNERFEADRTNAQGLYTFTVRARSDVDETMRIVWRGSYFDIRNVFREGSRPLYMQIDAERGV